MLREFGGLEGIVEHLREKYICSPLSVASTALINRSIHLRQAEKEEKAADAEDGAKKKKGGVQVPEEWPWEEAKKLFQNPDVLPSSEVEVPFFLHTSLSTVLMVF